jgi:uncharacterized protein YdeI (YjbR/CyaY-like superfamily)
MPKTAAKSFTGTLERMASRLNWVFARIPFDVAKVWGTRGQLKVKGEINGFAFRTSLFAKGDGTHYLLVNNRMQAGGKVHAGEEARFRLEPDTEKRTPAVPPELLRILSEERALLRWYGTLNDSTRNDIAHWITEVKSPEARVRRAEQIAERLFSVMEAEKDLPPNIRMALARDPRAQEGWTLMSQSRRRGHLMAIFYYREPAAQARRLAKAVQDAFALAERTAAKQASSAR